VAYNLGAILFDTDYSGRFEELLGALETRTYTARGDVGIQDATRREFDGIAVGVYAGKTLVLDQSWPYDCSFGPDNTGPLDEPLVRLSGESAVLCLLIDETSMSFGLAYFEGGELRRARKTDPDAVYSDWGSPLPAEAGLDADKRDDSERIMRLSEAFLGERLDTLIAANGIRLARYESSPG
jgi:hypothetical protein